MSLYYGFDKEGTYSTSSTSFSGNSDLDRKGHKITNLGHPVSEGDACNLKFVNKELGATKRGPKGDQGDVGKTGPAGRQGAKGDKGDSGSQGPKGLKGDKGDKGDPGRIQLTGLNSAPGPKGDKGDNRRERS